MAVGPLQAPSATTGSACSRVAVIADPGEDLAGRLRGNRKVDGLAGHDFCLAGPPSVRTWPERIGHRCNRGSPMLWTLILILLVLWALGLITAVGGAFIHLLLIVALVVLVAQLLTGRRAA